MLENKQVARNQKIFLMAGIVLVAVNLRMPLTAVSPLLDYIRESMPISNTLAGFLTTLPLIAFALISPFVSKISQKTGVEKLVFYTLLMILLGSIIRPIGNLTFLLVGTLFIGIGIAFGNVIIPSLIKKEFPFQLGMMTGIYSISMNLFAAIASGLSVPIATQLSGNWQATLFIWAGFVAVALLIWLPQLSTKRAQLEQTHVVEQSQTGNVWHSKMAWQIAAMMGIQSAVFYISVAFLPVMVQEQGFSSAEGGFMLSLMQFGIMPITFIVPIIAFKMKNQRALVLFSAIMMVLGILGLLLPIQNLAVLAVAIVCLGIGSGTSFSLCMMFFNLRTNTAKEAADMSGMAQSIGYLLAACGPILFGILHDWLGSFMVPLIILLLALGVFCICGMGAARNKTIFDA
ncbi:MFS transporter [Listeria sp. ILCC792]|uniref:CynX/NimT family MFS transporter n=1 Tax=Listeria sp. ILCC792 TaxID=1918331 RepID=UPI000B59155E|nr:MFS transporter [Listeria sp. ILCC792]